MGNEKKLQVGLFFMLAALLSGTVFAAPTGNEAITFYTNTTSIPVGGNATVKYLVAVTNGTPNFATTITVNNIGLLVSNSIAIIYRNNTGNAPFNGFLLIFAAKNTTPRTYNITLIGGGGNVNVRQATMALRVTNGTSSTSVSSTAPSTSTVKASPSNVTTAAPITIISTTTQNATTGPARLQGSGNSIYYLIALVIVIVVITYLYMGKGKKKPPRAAITPQSPP